MQRLTVFYAAKNPSKVHTVDDLLLKCVTPPLHPPALC